jgi:hypothetical protein
MGDQEYRAEVLAWAIPSFFKIINRLSTPGSPAHLWVMAHARVAEGLEARGILPPGGDLSILDAGEDPDTVIPRRPEWHWERLMELEATP